MFKAALFDLDGVVFDTEPQYTEFWEAKGKQIHPEIPDFAFRIKGRTLTEIYSQYLPGQPDLQAEITKELYDFEQHMHFEYVPGFETFVQTLRSQDIKTAVVTSSNHAKMANVYTTHPEFKALVDIILTSEDFKRGKPFPDCYLQAAEAFGLKPVECVGFEDSVNGMKAVKAADMYLIGLATTNPRALVAEYADMVIDNYIGFSPSQIKL